ncbi:hypothetical protein D3C77_508150 [compost metagenome]
MAGAWGAWVGFPRQAMRAEAQVVIGGWRAPEQGAATTGQCGGDAQVALHDEDIEAAEPICQLLAIGAVGLELRQFIIKAAQP